MRPFKTEIFLTLHQEASWVKKFGWYGIAFFCIKGALWLIAPFIIYAVNSISLPFPGLPAHEHITQNFHTEELVPKY